MDLGGSRNSSAQFLRSLSLIECGSSVDGSKAGIPHSIRILRLETQLSRFARLRIMILETAALGATMINGPIASIPPLIIVAPKAHKLAGGAVVVGGVIIVTGAVVVKAIIDELNKSPPVAAPPVVAPPVALPTHVTVLFIERRSRKNRNFQ